jgi:hypothetical protein
MVTSRMFHGISRRPAGRVAGCLLGLPLAIVALSAGCEPQPEPSSHQERSGSDMNSMASEDAADLEEHLDSQQNEQRSAPTGRQRGPTGRDARNQPQSGIRR